MAKYDTIATENINGPNKTQVEEQDVLPQYAGGKGSCMVSYAAQRESRPNRG